MIDTTTGSPLGSKITVTLQGVAYDLRYSALAEYVADDLGVNVPQFVAGIRERNAGNLSTFLKLFSAMVAHYFTARRQPIPSPEHWAAVLDEEPPEKGSEIFQAVADCLASKIRASAQRVKLREPTPAQPELQ
jgi:hypothetical protein